MTIYMAEMLCRANSYNTVFVCDGKFLMALCMLRVYLCYALAHTHKYT